MTTDTEALRRAFEAYINPDADIDLHWQSAGYYAGQGVQQGWLDFQAGYAAAKAEAAAPVVGRWYFVTNDGAATLCVDEADARESASEADIAFPRMAPHRAVQLVPADQLAEAQRDAERLDWIEQNANVGVVINRLKHITDLSRLVYEVAVDDVYATEDTLRAAIDAARGESNGTVRAERSGFDTLPDDYKTGDY